MQVAQIYQSIEFSRLTSLVPFVDAFQLERAIVDAARHCDLQVCAGRDTEVEGLEGLKNACPLFLAAFGSVAPF